MKNSTFEKNEIQPNSIIKNVYVVDEIIWGNITKKIVHHNKKNLYSNLKAHHDEFK